MKKEDPSSCPQDDALALSDVTNQAHKQAFSDNAIYLARTAQINTLTLSQLADQKASILIGATFVVFSLSVTKLIGAELTWAVLCLAITAFLSSLFAVLAAMPSLVSDPDKTDATNILFFGNFSKMEEEEWTNSLLSRFDSDEEVLRMMLRDVHQNGKVLHRHKFRYLSWAYRSFLIGLFVTMGVYLAEVLFGFAPIIA